MFEASIAGTNEPVLAGGAVTVEVTLTNTGETNGTGTVTVDAEELGADSVTVSLAAGASTTASLSFETGAGDAGLYTVTATSNGSSDTALVTVEGDSAGVPSFSVSEVDTTSPVAGDSLEVTAEVQNTGAASGTVTLSVSTAPALGTDSAEVSLAPGGSAVETLSLPTSPGQAGSYEVTVTAGEDQETATVTVEEAAEAVFEVGITGTNAPAPPGETLAVTAEVANTGDADGTGTVELSVGELGTVSTELQLAAGASTTETFTVETTADDAGEYTATLASGDSQDTATVAVETTPPEAELSSLDIAGQGSSASITEGADVPVAVDVTNVGGQSPDGGFEVAVNILIEAANGTVAPGPGETETLSLTGITDVLPAGTYDVTVEAGDDQVTGSLTVKPPVALSDLDIADQGGSATVTEGEPANIQVSVVNEGPVAEAFGVTLQVSQENGDTTVDVTEETDSIDPGLGFVVSFAGVVGDLPPGEFSVEVTTVAYGSDISVEGSLSVQADGSATSTVR